MFQFRAFPPYTYFVQCTVLEYCSSGFPHSEISGSMRMCRSPELIAACRVLLRLLMPRHSPCALISLTMQILTKSKSAVGSQLRIMQVTEEFLNRSNCSCYPIIPQYFQAALAALPSVALLLLHFFPLFSFQGADPGQRPDQNAQKPLSVLIHSLVEISGIEPLTSCVQSRRSPS